MAVTVPTIPYLILDADYVVVEVGEAAVDEVGHSVGRNVWEAFPGSEPFFRPHYETARRTGQPHEFVQFFAGRLARLHAVPRDGLLEVRWEILATIDTLTLDGLRASMDDAISVLEVEENGRPRDAVRRSLRVLDGGA